MREVYVIYLENGGMTMLDVGSKKVSLDIKWFNPRTGGKLQNGSLLKLKVSGKLNI